MKFKKPTSLFRCWLKNRNFAHNTLDTRCQIKSPMWPHKIWQFWGGKLYRRFTPQIAKYDSPRIVCTISGGVNCTDNLPLKLPGEIYPKSSVQFTPPKSPEKIYPSNRQVQFTPPPNHPILSKISDTQHHALLHKGLFCERPIKVICDHMWTVLRIHKQSYHFSLVSVD